jgi:hypothetical protein
VTESAPALLARVDAALRARDRLRRRPLRETAASLAAAAARWRDDGGLVERLSAAARLSPAMAASVVPIAAAALDEAAMIALVEGEWGAGGAARPAPAGPALVAHVLASNVPALALPAIALGCLAGAAVLVKSGRADPESAPAFHRALAAVDPDLAATVVATYWPGGDGTLEAAVLGRADVVVATGGETALASLAARVPGRLIAHGPRTSVAAIDRGALLDAAAADSLARDLALDIALYDQRGCLSPRAVYVTGGDAAVTRAFAERLARALDEAAIRLPPGPAGARERAASTLARAGAEWEPGAAALGGPGGTVVCDERPEFRATPGRRTVRVHPLAAPETLPPLLPPGEIECIGVAGDRLALPADALRARGVARICPVGRMQRPPLSWPRGQQPPLGVLLGRSGPPELGIEA